MKEDQKQQVAEATRERGDWPDELSNVRIFNLTRSEQSKRLIMISPQAAVSPFLLGMRGIAARRLVTNDQ